VFWAAIKTLCQLVLIHARRRQAREKTYKCSRYKVSAFRCASEAEQGDVSLICACLSRYQHGRALQWYGEDAALESHDQDPPELMYARKCRWEGMSVVVGARAVVEDVLVRWWREADARIEVWWLSCSACFARWSGVAVFLACLALTQKRERLDPIWCYCRRFWLLTCPPAYRRSTSHS
jgi:hypothetical protein